MSVTLTLTAALLLSGEADETSALPRAKELLAALPADPHQRIGLTAQLFAVLRSRPDILAGLIARGELETWPTLAALAEAGAPSQELIALLPPTKEAARGA